MPRRSRSFKVGLFRRLQDDAEVLTYLQVALEDSIPAFLVALRNVAEARQMSRVASCSNLDRANLYRMLQEQGNPRLTSLAAVLKTLGVRLSVEADNVRCVEQNDEVRTSHVTILPFEHKRTRYSL